MAITVTLVRLSPGIHTKFTVTPRERRSWRMICPVWPARNPSATVSTPSPARNVDTLIPFPPANMCDFSDRMRIASSGWSRERGSLSTQ